MSGPVLVAVDEDAGALRDVERELRDRYARHYRFFSPLIEKLKRDGGTLPGAYPHTTATVATACIAG
jgi:hypothetical protein